MSPVSTIDVEHPQDASKPAIKTNGVVVSQGEITNDAKSAYTIPDTVLGQRRRVKVIFIGFGLTGIDFAYKAKSYPDLDFQIYEKNPAAGGTWYENTYVFGELHTASDVLKAIDSYPGCACDVPIAIYQYSW